MLVAFLAPGPRARPASAPAAAAAPATASAPAPAAAAAPATASAPAAAAPPRGAPREALDRATLDRARAGEPAAMHAFVVGHERAVFALLSRLLGPGPHVEDLAQEAFLRALRALPAFDPDGPARVSTWLLTIATRLALDSRRAARRSGPPALALHELDEHAPGFSDRPQATPETERARRELGVAIARAAGRLSEDMRAAFLLADVHGFTLAEVGEALGIPEATAKTRVFRARQQLRHDLQATMRDERDGRGETDRRGARGAKEPGR